MTNGEVSGKDMQKRVIGAALMMVAVAVAILYPLTLVGTAVVDTLTYAMDEDLGYRLDAVGARLEQRVAFGRPLEVTSFALWITVEGTGYACYEVWYWIGEPGGSWPAAGVEAETLCTGGGARAEAWFDTPKTLAAGHTYAIVVLVKDIHLGASSTVTAFLYVDMMNPDATNLGVAYLTDVRLPDGTSGATPIATAVYGVFGATGTVEAQFGWVSHGLTANFTDETQVAGNDSVALWSWNFGDNATSTTQNPTHVYAANGTYTVSLTVVTAEGKSGTATEEITVAQGQNNGGGGGGDGDGDGDGLFVLGNLTTTAFILLLLLGIMFGFGAYLMSKGQLNKQTNGARPFIGILAAVGYILLFGLVL